MTKSRKPGAEIGLLAGRDIICFANDWGSDPLSKKQVMTRLAKSNRILWVNSFHNRRPRLASKDASRVAQKMREFFRGVQKVQDNIWQITLLYIPYMDFTWIRRLNKLLLLVQLRYAQRRLRFRDQIAWAFLPTSADVVGSLGESLIIYHCVDEYTAFSDAGGDVESAERRLLQKADLVLVSSGPLLVSKRLLNPHVHLILHGVDYKHFRRSAEDSTPLAPDLSNLPRPVLGFHGLLGDWIDIQLIAEIARKRPLWSVVLIGRTDTDLTPLKSLSNVHHVGHRPYTQLPTYLKAFDVALLPFVSNELTRNANPLKLREYLAAGLPVVASPLPEVTRLREYISLATTADEYIQCIEQLLVQGLTGPSRERSQKMIGESWDSKVQEIERIVAAALVSGTKNDLGAANVFN